MAETAGQAVVTAQRLRELRNQHRSLLPQLGRLAGSASQVLDALYEHPIVNINKLVSETALTPATAGKMMDRLARPDLNFVSELTGHKRNRVYAYSAYVDILNQG